MNYDSSSVDVHIDTVEADNFGSLTAGVRLANLINKTEASVHVATGGISTPGVKGDKGDTGATGPQGNAGVQGLKGDTGEQGSQGIQGPAGADGVDGANGIDGAQGEQGPQGIQGDTGPKGDTGDIGPEGPQGPQGTKGDKGNDGTGVTILGTLADESELPGTGNPGDAYMINGNLWVWSDTTNDWVDAGSIKGPQGEQGIQGPKGDTGEKGSAGTDGTQGIQGIQGVKGEKGDKGDTGDTGLAGSDGAQGEQGLQGPKGDDGDQGVQGIQGEIGPKGDKGDTGLTGEQGIQGETGLKGDKGDTGAKGDTGEQGLQGIQGPAGEDGTDGVDGNQGEQGPKGDQGTQGEQGIQGSIGPKGDKGDDGYTPIKGVDYFDGDDGASGAKGDKGDTGEQGEQGIQGLQGIQGAKGDKGDKGDDGDPATNLVQSVNGNQGVVVLNSVDVGLGNVDNTSDASKPVSTATQAALDGKLSTTGGNLTGGLIVESGGIAAKDTGGTNSVKMYHTGTYGQVESTTSFILTAPDGTTIPGDSEQLRVQNTTDYTSFYIDDTPSTSVLATEDFGANTKSITLRPSGGNVIVDGNLQVTGTYPSSGGSAGGGLLSIRTTRQDQFSFYDGMGSGWTNWYSNGTITNDTSNALESGASLKITAPASTALSGVRKLLAGDWSKDDFRILVKSDDWDNVSETSILVDTSNGFSSFYMFNITDYLWDRVNGEWTELTIPRDAFYVGDGTPDWTTVNAVIVRIIGSGTATPSVWFNGFAGVTNEQQKGIISLVFDDGYDNTFTTAKPIMDAKGYRGCMYIIPDGLGDSGYMTQAQLDNMHLSGWDIGGHHQTNLTGLTGQPLDDAVSSVATYLRTKGYMGQENFAYPNGGNNEEVRAVVQKYFHTARTINGLSQPQAYISPMRVNAFTIGKNTAVSTITSRIDDAIANGEWLQIVFHRIVTTPADDVEYSTANFTAVVNYLSSIGAKVLSPSQAMQTISARGDHKDAMPANPVVIATGAEVNTGTDNTKTVTALAIQDSNLMRETGATMTGAIVTADHGTATNPEVVSVVYGTGTPPTANTTPIGTLFIKYTA